MSQNWSRRMGKMLVAALLAAVVSGCATKAARRPSTPEDWRAEMQPPLTEAVAAELAGEVTLGRALELGVERNPAVAAARKRWLARIHVEPQELTPPDPMLNLGYQFESVETRVGPQQSNVGVMQQIPWPQKLWARGKTAATGADIAQLQYEEALRSLVIDVKDAYYELAYLDRALPVLERIERMLRNDAILAYSELTVGRTQLNEAFRAESQAAQLAYDRILLAEQRAAQAERLKSLLNLPPEAIIGPIGPSPVYAVSEDLEALQARAEQYAEMLKIRGLETQRAAYQTYLAQLSRLPDVTLGFNFINTGNARGANSGGGASGGGQSMPPPEDSGKDPEIGLLSMNLPIYQWRNTALIREKKALEQAMRLDALSSLNDTRAAVAQAYFRVRLTERLIALYDDTLLPQAEAVMDQAEVFFRNDQASFSNVIETTLAYQNFTLARLRAVSDHGQAIGQLERVLGTTAEPRSAPDAMDNDTAEEKVMAEGEPAQP